MSSRRYAPLVFASGAAALIYQILWLRELGLIIGNTSQAAAVGLAVFFAGMAAGSWYWGRHGHRLGTPLRTYALLELGIALSAVPYFWLVHTYRWLYAPLQAAADGTSAWLLMAAGALASLAFFPPAFLMGGTFPVIAEHVAGAGRNHTPGHASPRATGERLGRIGPWLYGWNTLGAATGALAAGFHLPLLLGFRRTYMLAMVLNVAIGIVAIVLDRRGSTTTSARDTSAPLSRHHGRPHRAEHASKGGRGARSSTGVRAEAHIDTKVLAALSGFLTLGLEVIATRLFAQVLQNSVYTFSAIIVTFLASLGLGALLARQLARLTFEPRQTLRGLLIASGLAVAALPALFMAATSGLSYVASDAGWTAYVVSIFQTAAVVLLIPVTTAGAVFPFLLRVDEAVPDAPGRIVGRLVVWNTAGSIAGSALTGFVLLPTFGLWGTVQAFALAYVLAPLVIARADSPERIMPRTTDTRWWQRAVRIAWRPGSLAAAVLILIFVDPASLPIVRVRGAAGERVLDAWEGPHGVTAVVENRQGRRIKVNNYYSLGGSASLEHERNQALIPLLTHPSPSSTFVLGLGSGITAGAAVIPPVERLVVAELIPEVVRASRDYFGQWLNGLFEDSRARVLVADGRSYLGSTSDRFDVVIADLFIPWEAGTGNLYTREHFQTVRNTLAPGGLFAQWLPLYQMSWQEFAIIARTMMDVFPSVIVWRGDFFAATPIVALVGRMEPAAIDPAALVRHARSLAGNRVPEAAIKAMVLPFYAGNLTEARGLIPDGPLNTDDHPIVEYLAPITHRQQRVGQASWLNALELLQLYEQLRTAVPPERDPSLALLTGEERALVHAGFHYYANAAYRSAGNTAAADGHWAEFAARVPETFRPDQDETAAESDRVADGRR